MVEEKIDWCVETSDGKITEATLESVCPWRQAALLRKAVIKLHEENLALRQEVKV